MPSVFCASIGPEFSWYAVDVEAAALSRHGSVLLPGNVQEAWPHPSSRFLYVAWSDGGPSYGAPGQAASAGSAHGISVLRVDPASGSLAPHGAPVRLPARPIHITVDVAGEHVITAYNAPSGITVHRIETDGSVGAEVKPAGPLDTGVYAHQVRVMSSNRSVILVTRGNAPAAARPEDPGALKVYSYAEGVLADGASIAPGGGFGFQPRHLDFDPLGPWLFLSLEAQNKLQVFRIQDDSVSPAPVFTRDTLEEPVSGGHGQALGTVHVHPGGHVLYAANRASRAVDVQGAPVWAGGENSIAVFRIDHTAGEPVRLQNVDSGGLHPRTFSVEPAGRLLVVGNQVTMSVRDGDAIRTVPANLSVFRVDRDGLLTFVRSYDQDTGPGRPLFWSGFVPLPD